MVKTLALILLLPVGMLAFGPADPVVDAHVAGLQKAASLTASIRVIQLNGSTSEQTLVLSRPSSLRWDSPSKLVVSDGKNITTYDKSKKRFRTLPFSETGLKSALTSDAIWAWTAFFNSDFGASVATTRKGPERTNKGVTTTDYVFARKSGLPITLMIDKANGIARGANYKDESGNEFVVQCSDFKLGDQPVAETVFAWNPPAGAQDATTVALLAFAEVKPIFDDLCVKCHGPSDAKGGVDLSSHDKILSRRSVNPGEAASSRVIRLIKSKRMPPPNEPQPSPEDVDKLTQWINDGANP